MKYLLIFLLVLVVFVISVTLGANNDQLVAFNYLLAQGEYQLSTLLATLFAAGLVLGWVICGLFICGYGSLWAAQSGKLNVLKLSLNSLLSKARLCPQLLSTRNNFLC